MGSDAIRSRWANGCGIATRHELMALSVELNRGVAGVVQMDNGNAFMAISVHFNCCGFAGIVDGDKRVKEAGAVAKAIGRIRGRRLRRRGGVCADVFSRATTTQSDPAPH
ncbi:hypothetical protein Mal65_00540 [Crateriforma conspicua]|nr:hypothetical protein Mal65_00540 [Crateriforma conspicua]